MKKLLKRILNKLKSVLVNCDAISENDYEGERYDFNKSNPLGGNGERVDIHFQNEIENNFDKLDMYQKNHFRRYEFARDYIASGLTCADFACGTGYGSVMLSNKANSVIGADINEEVISVIKGRYREIEKVEFMGANLLDLNFESAFDIIVSFETIEHFTEENIQLLLAVFYKATKSNGKLIFSTPYMQERSIGAIQLGHHLTFYINESKLEEWLEKAGFFVESFKYQNYDTHAIQGDLKKKDFIICIAQKR